MQNRLIPSPLSDCGRAGKSRREMGGQVAGSLSQLHRCCLNDEQCRNVRVFRLNNRRVRSVPVACMANDRNIQLLLVSYCIVYGSGTVVPESSSLDFVHDFR